MIAVERRHHSCKATSRLVNVGRERSMGRGSRRTFHGPELSPSKCKQQYQLRTTGGVGCKAQERSHHFMCLLTSSNETEAPSSLSPSSSKGGRPLFLDLFAAESASLTCTGKFLTQSRIGGSDGAVQSSPRNFYTLTLNAPLAVDSTLTITTAVLTVEARW